MSVKMTLLKKLLAPAVAVLAFAGFQSSKPAYIESKTSFAREVLQPFVDNGQLPGAICVYYKDGIQESTCVGYANVEQKRPITMDDVYMQCSRRKVFAV